MIAGYALAGLGAAFFSTKAIFIKLAYQVEADAFLMLAWRMIFALPVFLVIGLWAYVRHRADGRPTPTTRDIAAAVGIGFMGYYVASAFDFAGLLFITAQLERLVLFTYPLFVMFIGWAFYGEPLTRLGLVAAGITYAGLAIVFAIDLPEGGRNTIVGTLLVLGAAVSFALHQIWARRAMAPFGSLLFTAIALSSASVFCIAHQALASGGNFAASPRFLWLAAGCAVVATVLPTFLVNAGLARISSAAVSMISTLSPVVTIALAVSILGEPFTIADALGSTLVLAGVGLYALGDARAKRIPVEPEEP
ncbi:MAG: DMT family transporter [Hyphomicrobium sp.]|nr:DMT family transporter [Hyphomicrobium sp.]